MSKSSLQINILGASFSIQSDEESVYLEKLFSQYKRMVSQIEIGSQLKDPLKISILAGIMLCDEIQKEKKTAAKTDSSVSSLELAEAERLTKNMIEKINKVL